MYSSHFSSWSKVSISVCLLCVTQSIVAGRRVRAVVACTRSEDCCSPIAKRKEQNNGGIEQFFQEKTPSRRKSPPKKLINGINGTISQLSIFTPISQAPSTPHRIELRCSDSEETQNVEEIVPPQQTKPKKRLVSPLFNCLISCSIVSGNKLNRVTNSQSTFRCDVQSVKQKRLF